MPKIFTIKSVECESSQIIGLKTIATRSIIAAVASAIFSVLKKEFNYDFVEKDIQFKNGFFGFI